MPELIRAMFATNVIPARDLARRLGIGKSWRGLKILDIGSGSGVWGIGAAQEDPTASVAALDRDNVLSITREYAANAGVGDRFSYLAEDLSVAPLGENVYDLALVGMVCHTQNADTVRSLLGRLHGALRTNGKLAIIDILPNAERTAPRGALLFALLMLSFSPGGNIYTRTEYQQWLLEAGFKKMEEIEIASLLSPVIVAVK